MQFQTLQLAYEGNVATITLNRPDKRNAISFELIDDLLRALNEVAKSSALILILTGAGKAFCSGMDLENLQTLLGRSPEQNLQDSRTMAQLFRTLYEFPKVTIAAVNGAAIAGGTGLALLCDFTLAVPDAKFGYTEVRIGFVPAIVCRPLRGAARGAGGFVPSRPAGSPSCAGPGRPVLPVRAFRSRPRFAPRFRPAW